MYISVHSCISVQRPGYIIAGARRLEHVRGEEGGHFRFSRLNGLEVAGLFYH